MFRIVFVLFFVIFLDANVLQQTINNAPNSAILKLQDGIYNGNIIINKPITILGIGQNVVIKGDGLTKVITINSSNVILKNLIIKDSGNQKENLHCGIFINKVKNITIQDCNIVDCLYGIDMTESSNSIIINNHISSKPISKSLQGDALKLWYSHNNTIKNNIIENTKNITITRSNNNKIINNTIKNNMLGLYIELSKNNIIKRNKFSRNSVGIMLMGAKDTTIQSNKIFSSKGAAGIGLVIDGVQNLKVKNNQISYNAKGIYIGSKATEEGMQRYIMNNEISYNGEALHFHEAIKNNTITYNNIFGNIEDIVKDVRGIYPSKKNNIQYNYWDRYVGFDKNDDGIGDTPYQNYQYADQLWHYNHKVKFFYASPIMSLLNFLSNLAPFVEPIMLLEDTKPII